MLSRKTSTSKHLALGSILILLLLTFDTVFFDSMPTVIQGSAYGLDSWSLNEVFIRDSFENNTARIMNRNDPPPVGWTSNDISTENGAYIELVNNANEAHHGDFSCKIFAPHARRTVEEDPTLNPTYSNLMFGFGRNMTEVYVRWYQKFENLPSADWEVFSIFYFIGKGYVTNMEVSILRRDGQTYIRYSRLWGASDIDEWGTQSVLVNLTTDQWYCFEVWYKSDPVEGEYRAWFEGKEILRLTNLNTTPRGERPHLPNSFDVGILTNREYYNYTSWVDCVVAANTKIGPEGWTPPSIDLTVQVLDNRTKSPVSDAQVELASYVGYTNEFGFVTFRGVPAFSRYVLTASKYRYQKTQEPKYVTDITPALQISMEPIPQGMGALIVYTTYKGRSISAQLEITGSSTNVSLTTPLIVNLYPGTYELRAYFGSLEAHATASVSEGQTSLANIEFPLMKGILEIQIYSNLVPVSISVEITDEGGTVIAYQTPCKVELMPGTYLLKSAYAYQTRSTRILVVEGETRSVELHFKGWLSYFLDDIVKLSLIVLGAGCGLIVAVSLFRRHRDQIAARPAQT